MQRINMMKHLLSFFTCIFLSTTTHGMLAPLYKFLKSSSQPQEKLTKIRHTLITEGSLLPPYETSALRIAERIFAPEQPNPRIHDIVIYNHKELLATALENGFDQFIEHRDKNRNTALYIAAKKGY